MVGTHFLSLFDLQAILQHHLSNSSFLGSKNMQIFIAEKRKKKVGQCKHGKDINEMGKDSYIYFFM